MAALDREGSTGITRVVDHVFSGLYESDECQLTVSSVEALEGTLQFLSGIASPPPLAHTAVQRQIARVRPALRSFVRRTAGHRDLYHRVARRGSVALEAAGSRMIRRLDATALDTAQVFHSTFWPVPEVVRNHRNLQVFLTVYDLIALRHPEWFPPHTPRLIESILGSLRPADWILCISEATRRDFCRTTQHDPARVLVVPLAAADHFMPCEDPAGILSVRQRHAIPEGRYVLGLSTLEPRKNITTVIRAFLRLIERPGLDDLYLVLAGPKGWIYDAILAQATSDETARRRVLVTGFADDADLAPLYSGALAFVYMSLEEGFGLPPLEAMQCGTPVICSNASSLPEVVGDAGILVDSNDETAVSDALERIAGDAELRASLSAASLKQAETFSWQKHTRSTLDAYRLAIGA